jgi:hypothetical protein
MRERVLLFCPLGLVLTATIILVTAPGAVTWALPIQTHDVKRVFADIDTDHGDFKIKLWLTWRAPRLWSPCQLPLLAGFH